MRIDVRDEVVLFDAEMNELGLGGMGEELGEEIDGKMLGGY